MAAASDEDDGMAPVFHNVDVLCNGLQHQPIKHLLTMMRSHTTDSRAFEAYARRLHRILAEAGINALPKTRVEITTMLGLPYTGEIIEEENVACVSIIRSGDSLLEAVREALPQAPVGKILLQRDEDTAEAQYFYHKFPPRINSMNVLLVDPMLGTGGTAKKALDVLTEHGVRHERIVFLTVISCPEGIQHVLSHYPRIKIVTCEIDTGLNEQKYLIPGIGDYGDRFYGTELRPVVPPRRTALPESSTLLTSPTRHPWLEENG